MFNFDIGGNEIKPEASEGIIDIPFNRTLLAQKLTQNTPVNPETVKGLKTVEQVFNHYKPSVDVEFESVEGMPIRETLQFRSVSDFGVKSMVAQSPFLRAQDAQFQEYTQIGRRLKGHRVLQTALTNASVRASMVDTMRALLAELETADPEEVVA